MAEVFERYEKKYILTQKQQERLKQMLKGRVREDKYGSYSIYNIYYDTDNYDVIRKSTDVCKPVYKEKLRLRSYDTLIDKNIAFLELKKKYNGIVYKRRTEVKIDEAQNILQGGFAENQVMKEIMFYKNQNPVKEKVFISYDREAFAGAFDNSLRITFDNNIKFRESNLSLTEGAYGTTIMDKVLMEVKVNNAMPLWLTQIFSKLDILPVSFSKYGRCYTDFICNGLGEYDDSASVKIERVAS